ncbi:MAG: hypothetical protein HUU28_02970 [Planctomycetaceae bacterium]|nr:hypothetical protein [Planctomycetaceae bacterium]
MATRAVRIEARTPEEYVEALEARSQRRVAGGLIALHHRGQRQLGPLWKPLLGALGVATAVLAWKLASARRPASGGDAASLAFGCLRQAWQWRL